MPAKKDTNNLTDTVTSAVKQKRHRNRPDLQNFGEEYVQPGDNARYLRHALVSLDLPPIDISDPKQVEQRIRDYFQYCIDNDRKPNMIGLANWIGVSRETVNTWKRGIMDGLHAEWQSKSGKPDLPREKSLAI